MEFVWSVLQCCLAFCIVIINNGVEASHTVFQYEASTTSVVVNKLHRTAYHFQPTKNWINDPNGPMYYNGVYHLFYQYNPKGAVWGNIVWAHSVSTDMINWKRLKPAIYPSKPFDRYGCWSGSTTVLPGSRPVIMYTGIVDPAPANTQVQNYAVPANLSDPFLRDWVKPDDNPLIVADVSINSTSFRDPTTSWLGPDGHWRLTVGSRRNQRGISFLYRSRDFKHWVKAKHPLHSTPRSGNWECPDFYPVMVGGETGLETSVDGPNVKHVFKVSLDVTRYDYYTIGEYDTKVDKYIPDAGMIDDWNGLRYDYGNFYASKSFFDPKMNRRILWGWANESDTTDNDIKKGWAGIQLIPRTIKLAPDQKQLLQWPIKELETLRGKSVGLRDKKLKSGEKIEIQGIMAAQADVEVTFSFHSLDTAEPFDPSWDRHDAQKLCGQKKSTIPGGLGPFGLIVFASKNMEEYTPVYFRIFKDGDSKHLVLMCSDASRSTLMDGKSHIKDGKDSYRPSFGGFVNVDLKDKKLSLRSLIDHSVVESFAAGGRTVITSRVYPNLAVYNKAHLFAFNNGTTTVKVKKLKAYSMKRPAKMNH